SSTIFNSCARLSSRPTLARGRRSSGFSLPLWCPMRHCHTLIVILLVAPTLAGAQISAREASAAKGSAESPAAGALPGWLSVGGQLRTRAEAYRNGGFRPDNSDQYLLTRVLLNARVHPTRATSLFVE